MTGKKWPSWMPKSSRDLQCFQVRKGFLLEILTPRSIESIPGLPNRLFLEASYLFKKKKKKHQKPPVGEYWYMFSINLRLFFLMYFDVVPRCFLPLSSTSTMGRLICRLSRFFFFFSATVGGLLDHGFFAFPFYLLFFW